MIKTSIVHLNVSAFQRDFYIAFNLVWILIVSSLSQEKGVISGEIVDKTNGQPVISASVVVIYSKFGSTTDSSGRFFLEGLPPGIHTVRISHVAYETTSLLCRILGNDTVKISAELEPKLIALPPTTVKGSWRIWKSEESTASKVIEKEEIERANTASVTQMLRTLTPRVFFPNPGRQSFTIYLDSSPIDILDNRGNISTSALDNFMSAKDIERVVVWKRNWAPARFSRGSSEWVIAIYTK